MKNVGNSLQNMGREQFSRMAASMPVQQSAARVTEQTSQVFNELFRQLRAMFPASIANIKTQSDLDEFRRQWSLAFAENGITTLEQVNAGMRIARQQERPFLPSPGQFVAWCREGYQQLAGLPDVDGLIAMVRAYSIRRGYYDSAEDYPWKHPAQYWMVTALYGGMRANNWTDAELRQRAAGELAMMAARIQQGEQIPAPRVMIPVLGGKPLSKRDGLAKIAELREKHGLRRHDA